LVARSRQLNEWDPRLGLGIKFSNLFSRISF
jgi:hypothetical protein